MTTVNVYLNFDGNCLEAFEFYQSVFGGEFGYVGRFGDMPPVEGAPAVSDELKNKIMHISLPISEETVLMGSDIGGEWSPEVVFGNNFSLSVNTDSKEEAERIFNQLSEQGKVLMPFQKTFWQAWFGQLTDQFGVNWQVNHELASHKDFEERW